jgi:glycosyltransferase involved in cell wall biosynthesis
MGRIETGKGCGELFDFVERLGITLKVIGTAEVRVPRHVEHLGFVSEADKKKLIEQCRALVIPSRNESLSLAIIEAWAQGKPVVVSAYSPVLRSHVEKSGGGYIYHNLDEFRMIMQNIDPTRGLAGQRYVKQNYSWKVVNEKYENMFSFLLTHNN